jgi:caspase domain-containing protein
MRPLLRTRLGGFLAGAVVAGLLSLTAPITAAHAEDQTPAPAVSASADTGTDATPRGFVAQPTSPVNVGNPEATGPEQRVALVIGNSNYRNVVQLTNPANDARAVSQLLNSAGFEVIQATDLGHDEMIDVLRSFSAKIAEKGPNTVALVWYGGHGVQVAGDNYLIPVDAKVNSEADLPTNGIRLVDVMATLQAVPSRMRIVMVDACRNNPFVGLSEKTRGLAIVDAPNGSIVGYSTAPGTEAFDGQGSDSPYTNAVLKLARQPNVPVEQFFKNVRVDVNQSTDGRQTPWESSSLTSNFYFFGDTVQAARQQPVREVYSSGSMQGRQPRDAYRYALANDSVQGYQDFIAFYPSDPYCEYVRALLAAKLVAIAWHQAIVANSPFAYQQFYKQYPVSPYSQLALKLQQQPKILPLYQPSNNFAPGQFGQQFKFTNLHQINPQGGVPQLNPIGKQGGLLPGGLPQQGNLPINTINKGTLPIINQGNNQANGNNQGNGTGVGNGQIINKVPPGIDLAHGGTGVKINPVTTGNNVTTLPTNKIDPVVTGNHLPTPPNGNTGIVNKIDPVVTNRLPTAPNGNTGIIKPIQGNGQVINNGVVKNKLINNGPANNNAPQFHPTMVTTGNNASLQSHGPMMQGPVHNFGSGGGNNNMRSFHM